MLFNLLSKMHFQIQVQGYEVEFVNFTFVNLIALVELVTHINGLHEELQRQSGINEMQKKLWGKIKPLIWYCRNSFF